MMKIRKKVSNVQGMGYIDEKCQIDEKVKKYEKWDF